MTSATSNTVIYQLTLESSRKGYRKKLRSPLKRNKYVKEKLRKLHFAAQVGMLPSLAHQTHRANDKPFPFPYIPAL